MNVQTATDAQLQDCGVTKVPLSDIQSLPGGGKSYQYDLPDGQVISYPETPPNFDAVTAAAAEDSAYGVPASPPVVSSGYATWAKSASSWKLQPGENPDIYLYDVHGSSGPPNWAGYYNNAGGWTEAQANFTEPTIGSTSCSDAAEMIWSGLGGVNPGGLGQDGTYSDNFGTQHLAWFEVLPAGLAPFMSNGNRVFVGVNDSIIALTHYVGNSTYHS